MISFIPTNENTADLFTKFLNCVQHHKFCADLGLGRLDSARTSPMRGSIRVDRSASQKQEELEPAAAGTSVDSSQLNAFLRDSFLEKERSSALSSKDLDSCLIRILSSIASR